MQISMIIAFLLGSIVGAIICYLVFSRSKAESSIDRQLRELQEEFTAYRENVNTHFNKTAELVNTLTENYIAVQNHLEDSADTFTEPPKSFQLDNKQKLPTKKTKFVSLEVKALPDDAAASAEDANFETDHSATPPLDYAPKSKDKNKGMLSEEYGLHESLEDLKRP